MKSSKFLISVLFAGCAALGFFVFRTHPKFDNAIDRYMQDHHFQGSALIAKGDKILYSKAYGVANIENGTLNTPQTVYRIGSLTKQFTAALIMQMQEEKLLSVNDMVNKYIQDYPNGDKITIHHLLSHTSGIPDITHIPELLELKQKKITPLESLDYFKHLPLEFMPGLRCKYSNSGYLVLGAIIESISKKPYTLYLKEKILKPLGLMETYSESDGLSLKSAASGFMLEEGTKLKPAHFVQMSFPHASGGLSSNIYDLFTFTRSLKAHKILNQKSLSALFKIHGADANNQITYGYGFRIGPFNRNFEGCSADIIGHAGSIEGFESIVVRYDNDDLTIILLSNAEKTNVRLFHKKIAEIIRTSWRN